MYGHYGKSTGPKAALRVIHAVALCAAGWLLFGGGLQIAGRWAEIHLCAGDFLRRSLIFGCAAIYFVMVCFTLFYLMQRNLGWGEALGIGVYVLFVHVFFALLGGSNPQPVGAVAAAGGLFYLLGSFLNTGSEYLRYVWKRNPENKGRLYTGGPFRYAMHINYLFR